MGWQRCLRAEHSPTATFSPRLLEALAKVGGHHEGPLCPPPCRTGPAPFPAQPQPGVAPLLTSSLIASQLSSGRVHGSNKNANYTQLHSARRHSPSALMPWVLRGCGSGGWKGPRVGLHVGGCTAAPCSPMPLSDAPGCCSVPLCADGWEPSPQPRKLSRNAEMKAPFGFQSWDNSFPPSFRRAYLHEISNWRCFTEPGSASSR